MSNKNGKIVLIVIHSCDLSGAPLLGLNIAKNLQKEGYRLFIICLDKGLLFKKFKKYGATICLKSSRIISIIMRMLRQIGVRNVICNTVVTGSISKIARKNHMNVITLVHELPGAISRLCAEEKARDIMAYSDYVIFPNQFVKRRFLESHPMNSTNMVVKPQGLYTHIHKDYDEGVKQTKKAELGFLPNDKIILGIGYGSELKGFDLFYKVACSIKDKGIKFIWIGDIDKRFAWMQRQARDKEIIIKNPTLHLEDYYRVADLFLLTSREDSFPSTVLEAVAYGIPVLGFEGSGGFVELSNDFVYSVPYLDCASMAEKASKLLKDDELLKYIRSNGRKYINTNFRFSTYVKFLADLFT